LSLSYINKQVNMIAVSTALTAAKNTPRNVTRPLLI